MTAAVFTCSDCVVRTLRRSCFTMPTSCSRTTASSWIPARGFLPISLLVISFPPYTQLTIDALEYAAEAGVRIVAVTDSRVSPAATAARHTIVTTSRSPSFYHSFTGALAVVQALITLLVTKSGADAVKIVEEAELQLSRISAYW